MRLIMETYNRFSQVHNSSQNAYVAAASTGIAATNLNGITVHSALQINVTNHDMPLSNEAVNSYRIAFLDNVKIMFIDECSMIGAELLAIIDSRLKQIMFNYDEPFGGLDIIFSGDLRQLPPVRQTPIYKRRKRSLCEAMVWQALKSYTLTQVMRQKNEAFSSILTKVGNGEQLDEESKALIESRFVSEQYALEHCPSALRLFHTVAEVDNHNALSIRGEDVISHTALDLYAGYNDAEQLASARNKVHKMKTRDTGGLPYILHLQIDKQYMITTNIDVADGLVNGATGVLRYIEYDCEEDTELQKFILERVITDRSQVKLKRLWLEFERNSKIGKLAKAKCNAYVRSNPHLHRLWVPIGKRSCDIPLKSKLISCKRTQIPLVAAMAITMHKSQGMSCDQIVLHVRQKTHSGPSVRRYVQGDQSRRPLHHQ